MGFVNLVSVLEAKSTIRPLNDYKVLGPKEGGLRKTQRGKMWGGLERWGREERENE